MTDGGLGLSKKVDHHMSVLATFLWTWLAMMRMMLTLENAIKVSAILVWNHTSLAQKVMALLALGWMVLVGQKHRTVGRECTLF